MNDDLNQKKKENQIEHTPHKFDPKLSSDPCFYCKTTVWKGVECKSCKLVAHKNCGKAYLMIHNCNPQKIALKLTNKEKRYRTRTT